MAFKYPNTLKAMERLEYDIWNIADALLQDIPEGSTKTVEGAQKEAAENGYEYGVPTLQHYRQTAINFPPATRLPNVSMDVHATCGTPAMLKAVNDAWRNDPASKLTASGKPLPAGQERPLPRVEARRIVQEIDRRFLYRSEEEIVKRDPALAAKRNVMRLQVADLKQ